MTDKLEDRIDDPSQEPSAQQHVARSEDNIRAALENEERNALTRTRAAIFYLDRRTEIGEYIDRMHHSIPMLLELNPTPEYEDWLAFMAHITADFQCDTLQRAVIGRYALARAIERIYATSDER